MTDQGNSDASSSDMDDGPAVRTQVGKKKKNRVLSSDEESDKSVTTSQPAVPFATEVSDHVPTRATSPAASTNGTDLVSDSDKENVAPPIDTVDGCESRSDDDGQETTLVAMHSGSESGVGRSPLQEIVRTKSIFENGDLFEQESSDDSTPPVLLHKKKKLSKKVRKSPTGGRSSEGSEESCEGRAEKSESERSDDEERPKEGRWQKSKGAAKQPAKKRLPKNDRRAELNEVHSESQRLVRESTVSLPYWKPEPMNLQEILNRHKERKAVSLSLKPTTAEISKIQFEEAERKRKESELRRKLSIDKKFGIEDVVASGSACEDWLATTGSDVPKYPSTDEMVVDREVSVSAARNDSELPSYLRNDSDEDSLPPLNVLVDTEVRKPHEPDSGHCSQKLDLCDSVFSIPKGIDSDQLLDCLPDMTPARSAPSKLEQCPLTKQPKLSLPEEVVSFTPKLLDSGDQGFVDLDSDGNEEKSGVDELKSRFMKQFKKVSPGRKRKVEISYVHKEKSADGDKEELVLSHVTYTPETDDVPEVRNPGGGLRLLKERLRADLIKQRAENRKKKMEMMDLDNEEGFEEEAELTDESESDDQTQSDVDDGVEREESELVDDVTADDEDEDDDDMKLQLSDDDGELPAVNFGNDSRPQSANQEEDASRSLSRDSGEENGLTSSLNLSTQDMFTPFAKSMLPKYASQALHLELGIDDTQDLLKIDDDVITSPKVNEPSLEDTQSLLLDENGYLKSTCAVRVGEDTARPPRGLDQLIRGRPAPRNTQTLNLLLDGSESQDNMEDLLDLCTGKFTDMDEATQKKTSTTKSLFAATQSDDLSLLCSGGFSTQVAATSERKSLFDSTQAGELSDLCSGKFTTEKSWDCPVSVNEDANDGVTKPDEDYSHDEDDDDIAVDDDAADTGRQKVSLGFSDEEDTADRVEEIDGDSSEDEALQLTDDESALESDDERNLIDVQKRKTKLRTEFLEEEAELSGSGVDSDEDEEQDEGEDVLEQELGDQDDVGTVDQLRSQVGKVHMKRLMDEDKRELKLYQEMFLADGDLHSDNGGRERKFRWKNVDESSFADHHGDDSDAENQGDEDETELEIKRRRERFERERWLSERLASQNEDEDNANELIRLGRAVLRRTNSVPGSQTRSDVAKPLETNPPSLLKSGNQRHGSFLQKNGGSKMAEMKKPVSGHFGSTSKRSLVSSQLSPDDMENKRKKQEASQNEDEDNANELIRLGRAVLRRTNSVPVAGPKSQNDVKPLETPSLFKSGNQRHGSFLKKSNLSKIAEMTKPVSSHVGSTTAKNFVFSAVSPGDLEKKRKQHENGARQSSSQPSKRTKLEKAVQNRKPQPTSIFKLMN